MNESISLESDNRSLGLVMLVKFFLSALWLGLFALLSPDARIWFVALTLIVHSWHLTVLSHDITVLKQKQKLAEIRDAYNNKRL